MPTSTSHVTIHAPSQRVWEVLTRPELVRLWQYGSQLLTTWQPGTPIRFRSEWQGQVFEQWGTVIEFRPPISLKYSLFAPQPGLEDRPENYFFMTYQLQETSGGVALAIIQDDPRPGAEAVGSDTEAGDNPILQALKELAEAGGSQLG